MYMYLQVFAGYGATRNNNSFVQLIAISRVVQGYFSIDI